jgi:hypothetical protein
MANAPLGEVTLVPPEERVRLTIPEIEQRYPERWVVLGDVEMPDMHLTAGVVHAHSRDRRALRPVIRNLGETAIFWTGPFRGSVTLWLLEHVDRPV